MQNTLMQEFNVDAEIDAAYAAYPRLRLNTVFLTPKDGVVPGDPRRKYLRDEFNLHSQSRLARFLYRFRREREILKSVGQHHTSWHNGHSGMHVNFLKLNDPAYTDEGRRFVNIYSFDHELGHTLVGRSEGDADAFATMRHIQRAGRDSPFLPLLSPSGAWSAILEKDAIHLTIPVVNRIILDSRGFDFAALSPKETVRLARKYSEEHMPESAHRWEVVKNFAEAAALWNAESVDGKTPGPEACLKIRRTVARVAFSSPHPLTFLTGAYALCRSMEKDNPKIRKQGTPPYAPAEEWRETRDALAAKARWLGMEDLLLLDFPAKSPARTAPAASAPLRLQRA